MPTLRAYYHVDPADWWLTTDPQVVRAQGWAQAEQQQDEQENVRQWILRELIDSYHYPHDWLGTRITTLSPDDTEQKEGRLFGLRITTNCGDPFLWISVASPGEADLAEDVLS